MTNEEKIVLKNFLSISRKRDYKGGQKWQIKLPCLSF
jgi:hypothetical protein